MDMRKMGCTNGTDGGQRDMVGHVLVCLMMHIHGVILIHVLLFLSHA